MDIPEKIPVEPSTHRFYDAGPLEQLATDGFIKELYPR